MALRKRLASAAVVVLLAAASDPAAQDAASASQSSSKTFRSRVELITVDVTAVDKLGKPVEDLRPGDFTVKVDGRSRTVVSAELVKVDRSRTIEPSGDPADTLVATNSVAAGGRRVVIAVDQTLIAPGSIALLMRTASRFVDALAPADYAAVLAFPEPGPRVDFTTDRVRVREAMQKIVGQPAKIRTTAFNLSLQEAQTIDRQERTYANALGSFEEIWKTLGPTMKRVLERGCRSLTIEELMEAAHGEEMQQCVRDLISQAIMEALDARTDAIMSLRRLESFLKELAALDGPKSMVLVSAGLVAEDEARLDDIAKLAADARTTINVVAVDRERERDQTDLPNGQSASKLHDRGLELQGLETLADRTGGELYHAIGPAEGVFDRLALELTASYIVAVERRDGDPDRQRIEINVKRRGVTVRSPRTVTATTALNARRPMNDLMREALGSPLPIPGVPVRFSTFARRNTTGGTYRLNLAAQIGQPGAPGGEYAVGYAVLDQQGRVVASISNRTQLTPSGRPAEALPYDTTVSIGLQPGVYSVRLAVVASDGSRGTAVRRLELPILTGSALMTSDLIVGPMATSNEVLRPNLEPHIDGRIAAYLELYSADGDQGRLTVTLEIAEGEATPPLTSAAMNIAAGSQDNWRVASGAVDTALPPGRYVARAAVRRDGVPVRVVTRPFVMERRVVTPAPAERVRANSLSPEVKARTAEYVSEFVRGLSNVVGEEDFVLSGPDRRVTSDFLLVQHPASPGDLLTYRDVTHVNGTAIPDREERLADLFLKPGGIARDRARQVTQAAEQYVPSILNPIFVLAFLQADFQSRFELTVNDASSDWPPGVKAVTFVEVARPTILRAGLQGDLDVPVRGTAWIEPDTGRVLQTELVVKAGRSTTTMTTRFTLDSRLQIMVPEQMRTHGPSGVANYRNFRRFSVQTDSTVAPGR